MQVRLLVESTGLSDKKFGIVALQAIDGLNVILESDDIAARLAPFGKEVTEKLTEYCLSACYQEFFDIIGSIIM